jgi:hypothetical protein
MSIKQTGNKFGDIADQVVIEELQQLVDKHVFHLVDFRSLSRDERQLIISLLPCLHQREVQAERGLRQAEGAASGGRAPTGQLASSRSVGFFFSLSPASLWKRSDLHNEHHVDSIDELLALRIHIWAIFLSIRKKFFGMPGSNSEFM